MANSYPCKITSPRIYYSIRNTAYIFRKDSEYIELINYAIEEVFRGRSDAMELFARDSKQDCTDSHEKHFRTFSYDDVISAYAILIAGCIFAVGYLLIECTNQIVLRNKSAAKEKEIRNDSTA